MTEKEQAIEYYKEGYNCAQAVICAYCHRWNLDADTAYRLVEGFGGGMGQLGDVCGAASAAFAIAGLMNSSGTAEPGGTKKSTYGLVQKMAGDFKGEQGSIYCREILKDKSRPKQAICEGCVAEACDIVEKYLLDKE